MSRCRANPNDLGKFTISPKYVAPRPASEKRTKKGGKIRMYLTVPPYLYEIIRKEAFSQNITLNRMAVILLEAAAAGFPEE
jgi:hypothetical protein